jgi:hypothetical protein
MIAQDHAMVKYESNSADQNRNQMIFSPLASLPPNESADIRSMKDFRQFVTRETKPLTVFIYDSANPTWMRALQAVNAANDRKILLIDARVVPDVGKTYGLGMFRLYRELILRIFKKTFTPHNVKTFTNSTNKWRGQGFYR